MTSDFVTNSRGDQGLILQKIMSCESQTMNFLGPLCNHADN